MVITKNRHVMNINWYGIAQVLFALIALITISLFFLFPEYWYLWFMIISGGFAFFVAWHAKKYSYLCPGCGEVFKVSSFDDLISPNGVNKKYLRCPMCRRRAWADILRIKELTVLKK